MVSDLTDAGVIRRFGKTITDALSDKPNDSCG